MSEAELINELQTHGMRMVDPTVGMESRRGGAGPTDHKAVTIGGSTVMVPVHTAPAFDSPYVVQAPDANGMAEVTKAGVSLGRLKFPGRPRFYDLKTADGIEYHKIATLHSRDVLATTVLQECIRYASRKKTCQFCSIGQSLAAGRTIAHKTPAQLAEVAKAAVELDGVKHMVMTTGTPAGKDRGAQVMVDSAAVIKAVVDLPIQGQCEPPADDIWHERMFAAGIENLGMHLEAVTPDVRARVMPGKAQVSLDKYFDSFKAAVKVFGRGQVSTYIIAGLGDTPEAILETSQELCKIGVYPFVVPFVPISGTPMESHPTPNADFMASILKPLSGMILRAGMSAESSKAGCAKCGACSALSVYEKLRVA
ncbi:MSMEG_0568 family radical SAM protein [Tateyamaria omphalii]|uniref:MSMEG_0568 family radical SAM protein n=1 Tax=Tateyamaria omphalii TaxID=299262 RepID=UPI001C999A70|nr:MSMEG_0568 family radical SAM protein [Tateyamaria omphalii]MBY5934735.1 MSMEG_0568 family radical SAM protein [Tateyamaria omphalii]